MRVRASGPSCPAGRSRRPDRRRHRSSGADARIDHRLRGRRPATCPRVPDAPAPPRSRGGPSACDASTRRLAVRRLVGCCAARPRATGSPHVERVPARAGRRRRGRPGRRPALVAARRARRRRARGSTRPRPPSSREPAARRRVATGTASGKSLAYLLPALTAVLERRERRARGATVALPVADQGARRRPAPRAGRRSASPGVRAADLRRRHPAEERDWVRDHAALRADQPRHAPPLDPARARALGVVPARPALRRRRRVPRLPRRVRLARRAVLRRLRRVCARYGSDPTFVLASATVVRPGGLRRAGSPACRSRAVDRRRLARGGRTFALWEPPLHRAARRATARRSAARRRPRPPTCSPTSSPTGARTLAFVRSRRGAEAVALDGPAALDEVDPALAAQVAAYRAGYLPEERRALEQRLHDRRAARRRRDQRARARRRRHRARRRPARRLARARARRCGSRPGAPGAPVRARWPCSSPATTRSTPTSSTTPRRSSVSPSRPPSSTPTTPTCSARTCARAAAELPLTEDDLALFGRRRAAPSLDALVDARAAAAPVRRLVLDRPRAGHRPGRPPRHRRHAGPGRRGRHRPAARHRRRRGRARHRARGRGLRAPGRTYLVARSTSTTPSRWSTRPSPTTRRRPATSPTSASSRPSARGAGARRALPSARSK